jgi:thiol-disulfide isomerase/thioredoxin
MKSVLALLGLCALAAAQTQVTPPGEMSPAERESLSQALGEAGNSTVDFVRALENHISKYPNSPKRSELERALVKSAMDLKDNARIIRWGERVLEREPDDLQILERVTVALLQAGGTPNFELALKHAEHFEQVVERVEGNEKSLSARELARHKDEHDRAEARAYLIEARAHGMLGHTEQAMALAQKSYEKFSSVEAAREAARWLDKGGKPEQAIQYLANAFTISGLQSANPDAEHDREQMGELYRKLKGSEKGLGDVILKAYDRTFSELAARRERIRQMDPNAQLKDPMEFTLSDVSGGKLQLATLKGKVIVMDFWATWCGPCRAQHPLYEEVKNRFKDRSDVVFLSIDTDEDHSLVKPFLDQNNWTQKVYFEDGLAQLMQASSIPMTLIFNRKGEVFSRMNGFIPERFVDMLSDRIHEALGEKIPAGDKPVIQATAQ